MGKKMKKRDFDEIEATKRYHSILKKVYQEKGLFPALGYEVKSTWYSLGKRISNLFELYAPPSSSVVEQIGNREEWDNRAIEFNKKRRKINLKRRNERLDYILRGEQGLPKKVFFILAIIGFCAGIFFLSLNLTGNAVGNLNPTFSNWIGGVLFISGLIGAFFALRKNNFKYSLP